MKKKQKRLKKHSQMFLRKQALQQERFLASFRRLGRQNKACEESGISQDAVWDWRRTNPKFEAKYQEADAQIGTLLEDEAIRRAVEGVDRKIFYEGVLVATEKEYSDALLKAALVARNRRYRAAAEESQSPMVPNVTVINYGSPHSTTTDNTPAQVPTPPVPTPNIKSYR